MSDSSFVGTSAQWSSARTSTPLQMAYRARRADPLIILDELDKAGHSRANGSLVDGLLAFLEPTSARALCDLALEVDLSAVSYIATANDLDAVPSMLRDRFRVIRMPSPRIEHAAALSALMIDAIASERGIDRRWLEPLAKDELEIVTKAWTDRSIRRLRRMIEQIIDGR